MSVFSKIRDFFGRHRGKFIVGGVLIAGSVILTKYAQQRLKDWQERETREFLERTRKQQHFENTERTCNQTIMSLSASLFKQLNTAVEAQSVIDELKSSPQNLNKMKLWHQLRVAVFTRITSLIYLSVMLVVLLRVQLNIIGGYVFRDANSVSTAVQESYLGLCNNLLDGGLKEVVRIMEQQYDKLLPSFHLSQKMLLKDFEQLFWSVQNIVNCMDCNPVEKFKDYVLSNIPTSDDPTLANMIRDTADLLESNEVKSLTVSCLNRGFALVSDELSSYYLNNGEKADGSGSAVTNGFVHPCEAQIPFGKLLPILHSMSSSGSLPDSIMSQLILNERLKTLGANIYECFSAPSS